MVKVRVPLLITGILQIIHSHPHMDAFLLNACKPKLELREGYKFISSLVQQFSQSCCLVIF